MLLLSPNNNEERKNLDFYTLFFPLYSSFLLFLFLPYVVCMSRKKKLIMFFIGDLSLSA